jgi:hypothetical protein
MFYDIVLLNYMKASNVIFEVFEIFKKIINLFKNRLSIYFTKFASFSNCEKVGLEIWIWKFHSYVAFWKGLVHDLMN